ncbi:MAG: hypothetical protein WCI03_04985, partial [bacterium]
MGPGVPPLALDFNPFRVADLFITIQPTSAMRGRRTRSERASCRDPKTGWRLSYREQFNCSAVELFFNNT